VLAPINNFVASRVWCQNGTTTYPSSVKPRLVSSISLGAIFVAFVVVSLDVCMGCECLGSVCALHMI